RNEMLVGNIRISEAVYVATHVAARASHSCNDGSPGRVRRTAQDPPCLGRGPLGVVAHPVREARHRQACGRDVHGGADPFRCGAFHMITALATGEVDIAAFSYSTIPNAVQNAALDDLRIIADEFQDGVQGYYTNQFMVRKDSSIRSIEDLRGKIVATNGAGSPVDIALRSML